MNLGKRIEARLNDLKKDRQWLLGRVEELSAQALSNLIVRDSKRSEWDERIAEALGVSVLWLVYGYDQEPARKVNQTLAAYDLPTSEDETRIIRAFRLASDETRAAFLAMTDTILRGREDLTSRTGTT